MARLKISDLSVGDWVRWEVYDKTYDIRISQITDILVRGVHDGIEYGMKMTQMFPIPITAEALEKNGWFRIAHQCVWNIADNQGTSHDGEYVITWFADDEYLIISWGGREDEVLVERTIIECRVKYIHQLQHALRLAGVDKEINL